MHNVTAEIVAGRGDKLPVSAFPVDGTFPTGTAQWEKRNIAMEIPVWYPDLCIQCNKCTLVCPLAAIRAKVVDAKLLEKKPATFKAVKYKAKEYGDSDVHRCRDEPEDGTGCNLAVQVCPATDKKDKTNWLAFTVPPRPIPPWKRM